MNFIEKCSKNFCAPTKSFHQNKNLLPTRLLISKSKWIPNDACSNCFNCNKPFSLFRRKHHCRMCGNVLCSKCTNFWLNALDLDLESEERHIRVCEYCYGLYLSFLKPKLSKQTGKLSNLENQGCLLRPDGEHFQGDLEFESSQQSGVKHPQSTLTSELMKPFNLERDLTVDVARKIEEFVKFVTKEQNIFEEWYKTLLIMVKRTINEVRINTLTKSESMDICEYIKIKKIIWENSSESKVIKGFVCRKKLGNRKFLSPVSNPRILVLENSIDIPTGEEIPFQELINCEKKFFKPIMDRIKRLNPSVLIVEKRIHRFAQDLLNEMDIIFYYNFTNKTLHKIAKFTGARVIRDVLLPAGNLKPEDILGTCRSFYTRNFKKVNNDSIILTGDPSIMFFDGCSAKAGGLSLTLSGRDSEQLIKVKRSLKTILRLARHFLLEKELVLHDRTNLIPRRVLGDGEEIIKLDAPLTHGDFSKFLDNKTTHKRLLQEEPINFSQICLVKGMLENFNDLQDDQQAMNNINKKITENIEKNQGKIDFFAEICCEAKLKEVSPYLENDIAIGHFIILKVDKLFKKCKHCNRPKYHHLALYYSGGSYVKISTELTGLCRALAIREETTDLFVSPAPFEQLRNNDLSSSTILDRRIAEIGTNGGSMLINHFRDSPRVKRANSVSSLNNEGFFLRKMSMVSSLNQPNIIGGRNEESEQSMTAGKSTHRKSSFHQRLERSERSSIFSFNAAKPEEEARNNNNEKNTFRRYQSLYRLGQLPGKDVIIKSYIECSTCKVPLTEESELKPAYLEYSFSKFLKHLFLQEFPKDEKQKVEAELSKKNSMTSKKTGQSIQLFQYRCGHSLKSRVFKYDEILVKISVSTAEYYILRPSLESDRAGGRRPSRADVKQKVDRLKERTVFLLDNLKAQALFILKNLKQSESGSIFFSDEIASSSEADISKERKAKEKISELELIIQGISKFSEEFDRQHMKLKGLLCLDNMRLSYFKKILEFYEALRGIEQDEKKSTKNIRRVKTISKEFNYGSSDRFVVEIRSPRALKRMKDREKEKAKKEDTNEESWMGSVSASEDNVSIDRRSSLEFIKDLLLNYGHGMCRPEDDNPQFHSFQFYRYISVSRQEPLQAVAFALNSTAYLQDVYFKEGFYEYSKILYNENMQKSSLEHQKQFLKFKLYLNELVEGRDHITVKGKFNQDWAEQTTIAGEFEKFTTKYLPSNILFKKATNNGPSADEESRNGFSTGNEDADTKQSLVNLVNEKMPIESLALSCQQWEAQTLKLATEKAKPFSHPQPSSMLGKETKYSKIWANHDISDSSYMAEENASCDSPLIEQKDEGININSLLNLQKTVKVKILFPAEFEAVRSMERIYLADFIDSIAQIKPWVENTGGKSKASFVKSRDGLYVFKSIKKREFKMFSQFAHKYFKYLWKSKFLGRPSILSRMLGLYEVLLWGRKSYSVAMENLFLGMEWSEGFKVYDLKGSEVNRYIKEGEETKNVKQVYLDTNFKVDQNGEPLPIKLEDFKFIMQAIENDTKFLSKQNLIDYSVLLIIDSQKHVIKVGIIDYLRTYTWDKKLETVGKKVMKGVTPTVVNPLDYRERFVAAMKRYFMPIPVD